MSENDFWGERVSRWPRDVVAKMGIAADDASYLTTVGLPIDVDWNLRVTSPASGAVPESVDAMPVLAFDGPVPICVDAHGNGSVVAVEDAGRRLVNSSVRQFGRFLMIYQDYRLRVRDLDDTEAEMVIDDVEGPMKQVDGDAMRGDESYWPVMVEQMRHGLL